MIETGDADAVSIRAIADAVGVTPPSIYLHFPDKDALIVAVCERHFEVVRLDASRRRAPSPTTRSRASGAAGAAYVRFGLEQPRAVPDPVHDPNRRRPPSRQSSPAPARARSSTSSTRCSAPSTSGAFRPGRPHARGDRAVDRRPRHHVAAHLAARLPVARRRGAGRPRLRHPDPRPRATRSSNRGVHDHRREPLPRRQLRTRQATRSPSPTSPSKARSRPNQRPASSATGPTPSRPTRRRTTGSSATGCSTPIELRDGKAVSYRNRWVRTDQALDLLGEDADPRPARRRLPRWARAWRTPTSSRTRARSSPSSRCASRPQVRPDLSTVGRYDFDGKLRSAMTAHPKVDPVTGEMLFFGYDTFGPPWLRYHVVNATGELVRSEDIDIRGPSMVHDFAITERNVVFFDLPVVFDFDLVGKRPFPAEWKPDYGARVGVMPRDGGNADVRWFDVELCYVFHPLNAYDENGERGRRRRPASEDVRHGHLRTGRGAADARPLDDRPRRRQGRRGAPRRPSPGVPTGRRPRRRSAAPVRVRRARSASTTTARPLRRLLKHDLEPAPWTRTTFGPGTHAGEGVFVPAAPTAGEDEGWLLSVVYDDGRDASDLVVLDAASSTRSHGSTYPNGSRSASTARGFRTAPRRRSHCRTRVPTIWPSSSASQVSPASMAGEHDPHLVRPRLA